jgi:4-hydroxymandelate oxidase
MIVAEPWPLNVFDVERWALAKLPRDAADYFAGGAEDEVTLRANRAALEAVTLRPRVLVDVGALDTRVTVLGTEAAFPVLVAPTGFQQLAHLEGERAMARGTAAAGTVMVVSTYATVDLEQVLVERATEAGYRALVVTADVPVLGRRERDLRNQFLLPTNMRAANFPALDSMELHDAAARESALEHFHAGIREPSFTWKDLDWLASLTSLPLVLKGVLRGDDTRRALDRGVRGLIVSNHGGRQLDGAVPTIRALPEVVAAVDGAAEVLMDGGIRRGVDVVRALALGARAVLIGRPAVYGLAWNGARGVQAVLELLRTELETAMALCGAPSVSEVTRDLVEGGGQSAKR